jgi:tetratricopeptide (TPR) repeat protein
VAVDTLEERGRTMSNPVGAFVDKVMILFDQLFGSFLFFIRLRGWRLQSFRYLKESFSMFPRAWWLAFGAYWDPGPYAGRSNLVEVLDLEYRIVVRSGPHTRWASAERLCRRILGIHIATLGPDHLDVARDLYRLASLRRIRRDWRRAEMLYRQLLEFIATCKKTRVWQAAALQPSRETLYDGHFLYCTRFTTEWLAVAVVAGMGKLYYLQKDFARAMPLYRFFLALWRHVGKMSFDERATALNEMAGMYIAQGELWLAAALLLQVISDFQAYERRDQWGWDDVIKECGDLVPLLAKAGDATRAEQLSKWLGDVKRGMFVYGWEGAFEEAIACPTLDISTLGA